MLSRDELIANGRACLRAGDADTGVRWLHQAVLAHPDDALVWFEYAGAFDVLGREAEAVAPYERARELGLPADDEPRWHIQYGSTLRNLGRHDAALAVMDEGCARFPQHLALQLFRALALYSAGRHGEALAASLRTTLQAVEPARIDGYERALHAYADALRDEPARGRVP